MSAGVVRMLCWECIKVAPRNLYSGIVSTDAVCDHCGRSAHCSMFMNLEAMGRFVEEMKRGRRRDS